MKSTEEDLLINLAEVELERKCKNGEFLPPGEEELSDQHFEWCIGCLQEWQRLHGGEL